MTIDWISILLAVAGGVITHLLTNQPGAQATGSTPTTPAPTPTMPSTTPASPNAITGHPLLNALMTLLQNVVATNPQLAQLEGAVVTLIHPNGNINLSLNQGGKNATAQPSTAIQAASGS